MNFSFLNKLNTRSITSAVRTSEYTKYDYNALAKEFEDKCPVDYPWMRENECQKLGTLWAWQAGSMSERPEIEFDNELFATRDRAKHDGRLASDASGFETYYENHPIPKCDH